MFFGTSNDTEFLKDYTGNRRFWPVDVGVQDPVRSVFDDLPGETDQIWAEAVAYWRLGEPLYLTGDVERLAQEAQEEHRETSGWEGLISDFLEKEVPAGWDKMDISSRRMFLQGNLKVEEPLHPIDKVCVVEIWVECLGGDQRYMKPQERSTIGIILKRMPGWKRIKSTARFGPYGIQKGFVKG